MEMTYRGTDRSSRQVFDMVHLVYLFGVSPTLEVV